MKAILRVMLLSLSIVAMDAPADSKGKAQEAKFDNPIVGEVFYTRGKVLLTRDNNKFQLPNKPNAIRKNDRIKTYKGAIAIIAFGPEKGSKMKIDQDSEVVIDELLGKKKGDEKKEGNFNNTVSILKGSLNVIFNKNKLQENELNVKTRYATFGIRGTEFFVTERNNAASFLAVKDGVVAAIQKGPKNKDVESLVGKETAMILTPYLERVRQENPDWMQEINWSMNTKEYLVQSDELFAKIDAAYKKNVKNQAPPPEKVKGLGDLEEELKKTGGDSGSSSGK